MAGELEGRLGAEDVESRREAVLALKDRPKGVAAEDFARLLLRAMQDQSWRIRKTAVDVLIGYYPIESFINGLIKLLYIDDNAGARNSAIEVLIKLGKKATGFLMEAFKTPNADVRKFIIDIIGEIKDKRSLSLLVEALKDEDENVKASAVEHLGAMEEPSVVGVLIEILWSSDLWTAYPAVEALGRIGDPKAVPALVEATGKKTLREPAIRALGKVADGSVLPHIVPFVEDRSKAVQHEALCALELLYHKGVAEGFISDALREHFGGRTSDVLIEHAKSSRTDVKGSAILLLGLLKDERTLGQLLEMSEDKEFADDVKKAMLFIGREKPEALLPLFMQENDIYLRFMCDVAMEVASPVFFDIIKVLAQHEDGHIKALAALCLSNIGDIRAVELIKPLMLDPYPDVQEAAVKALAGLREGIDTSEFISMMKGEDPVLRKNVALLLGEMGSSEAVSALGFAMKDEDENVRKAVVTALSKMESKQSMEHLLIALTDEDASVRAMVAMALGQLGETSAFEHLSLLLNDSNDMVKVSSIKALGMLGDDRAVLKLIEMLYIENGFVVTTAMESIGRLGGEQARGALMHMLGSDDAEFRRTAIRGLAGFENVEHVIVPFLRDGDWATRIAAVEALRRHPGDNVTREVEMLYDFEEDPVVKKALKKYLDD
jgi:HEAT repeat protein